VQAFLQKPLGQLPDKQDLDKRQDEVRAADLTRGFLAVTELQGDSVPKVVVGVSYAGPRETLEALVNELRQAAQRAFPYAKSDVEKYGAGEIETFTAPAYNAALAWRGKWLFLATDKGALKSVLDRFDAPATASGTGTLAELPAFKKSLGELPAAPDGVVFLRPNAFADQLGSLLMMVNPTGDMSGIDKLKQIEAISYAVKLDGSYMRDALFVMRPPAPGDDAPLSLDALKLTSADTIIASCGRFKVPADIKLPDSHADATGMLQVLASYLKIFQDQGLGLAELGKALGPESGFILDWQANSMIPAPLVMADVKDQALAGKFLDAFRALPAGNGEGFTRIETGGVTYYNMPLGLVGILPMEASFGLNAKGLVAGLSRQSVGQAFTRWSAGNPGITATDPFKQAAGLVQKPGTAFVYIDTKAIFEHAYGIFRSIAGFGFIPQAGNYVDLTKLPPAEAISQHLHPLVSSAAVKDGGTLQESAGTVTMSQAELAGGVLFAAAAIPLIEQQLKGQSVSIPGFPGFGASQGFPGAGSPSGVGNSAQPQAPAVPSAPPAAPAPPSSSASPSPAAQ
jgi:hypothetical protein